MGFILASPTTKKVIVLLLVAITVLNIIAAAFLYLDIQTMQAPETVVTMDLVELTADEAVLSTSLWIKNPNSFSFSFRNLTVRTITDKGDVISTLFLDNGDIPGHTNTTFHHTSPVHFNTTLPTQLTSTMTGTIGVTFLGIIQKTLPVKFTMITSLNTITNQFTLPSIHLDGNFSDITQEGVNFTGIIDITNPYTFPIVVDDLIMTMNTDTGLSIGSLQIEGATIAAKTNQQLTSSGRILLKVLDAKKLIMNLSGGLTVYVAGLKQTLNLSFESSIIVPRIENLLTGPPMDSSLTGVYQFTLHGFVETIAFEVINPHKIAFLAKDIVVNIYRIDRNNSRLIGNGTLEEGIIAPQATTVLHGQVRIPYSQLVIPFKERVLPNRLQVIMRANVTIPGLNQTLWVGMVAYQDIRKPR